MVPDVSPSRFCIFQDFALNGSIGMHRGHGVEESEIVDSSGELGEREGGARFGGWEGSEVGFLLFRARVWHKVSLRNLILRTVLILTRWMLSPHWLKGALCITYQLDCTTPIKESII